MTIETIGYFNTLMGLGTVALQLGVLATIAVLLLRKRGVQNAYLEFIDRNFLWIAFGLAFMASAMPLVYSEIIGFPPCALCWWQRVFMLPNLFLFGVALYRKERLVVWYALPLLVAGALFSLYHNYFYYIGDNSDKPCDASGISCYQQLVSVFDGYVSIPSMALTAFLSLIALILVVHFYRKGSVVQS